MFEKKSVMEEVRTEPKKKEKVKKPKREKKPKGEGVGIKAIVIPLLTAAIVVCLIYAVVQKGATSKVTENPVLCAKTEISANTHIAKEKVEDYFEEISMDAAKIPQTAVTSIKELPEGGFYIENKMAEKQMLLTDDVEESDAVMDKYTEGTTTTSFAVAAFSNSISGTVRHGDIVDIYAVDPSTEGLAKMVSHVYVVEAYDSSGAVVAEGAVATGFTIKVAPEEVEAVNNAISYGGIQLYLTKE